MGDEKRICRFCLKICEAGFEAIEDRILENLKFLLLNMDLGVSEKPVICQCCIDSLDECVNFKTDSLCKGDSTLITHGDVKINTSNIRKDVPNTIAFSNIGGACCFCMQLITHNPLIYLKNEEQNTLAMVEKYFPELILNVTEDFVMCARCCRSLQNHLNFISNCMTVEERIKEYRQAKGTINKNHIELINIQHFAPKYQLQLSISDNLNIAKTEENCEETEYIDKAKVKNECSMEVAHQEFYNIKDEDIKIETDQDNDGRLDPSHFEQINGPVLQLPMHEIPLEGMIYRCEVCTYLTKHKRNLLAHMLTHKSSSEVTMHKCGICAFETKHSYNLRRHMLIHKSTSEVTMYKCDICEFSTKRNRNLQAHLLIHRSNSEITMYDCQMCEFRTRHKYNLTRHMTTHDGVSQDGIYRCEVCVFDTDSKKSLSIHMLTHRRTAAVYKCQMCSFRSTRRTGLRLHMLTHKSTSEITMYKCASCSFLTKYKKNLSRHMSNHKSTSELRMFRCEICGFQTKYKRNIQRHMVNHKDVSGVTTS